MSEVTPSIHANPIFNNIMSEYAAFIWHSSPFFFEHVVLVGVPDLRKERWNQ